MASIRGENDLPIYHSTSLITVLAAAISAITAQEHTHKSQHETILADLYWYTEKTFALVNNFNR